MASEFHVDLNGRVVDNHTDERLHFSPNSVCAPKLYKLGRSKSTLMVCLAATNQCRSLADCLLTSMEPNNLLAVGVVTPASSNSRLDCHRGGPFN